MTEKHNSYALTVRAFLLIVATGGAVLAQSQFEVTALTGTARSERSEKKTWEDLAVGKRVSSNDIVETFFQTRLVLEHASGTVLILGSNSKIMISVQDAQDQGRNGKEINVTVFGGGCFSKAGTSCLIKVFSANAVAEFDSGAVSAVVEEKSGETGYQILQGSARVRNVAQQTGKRLGAGQTTIIFPRKEPTVPLYITNRHVAVLKHFFGEDYIENQLESSGITPTEDTPQKNTSRTRISENLLAKKEIQRKAAEGTYKRLFSADKIYGTIAEEQAHNVRGINPIAFPMRLSSKSRSEFLFRGGSVTGGNSSYPFFFVQPRFSISLIDIGLKLSMEKNYESFGLHQIGNVPGIFDVVEYFSVGVGFGQQADSFEVSALQIDNFNLGSGLAVSDFSSHNPVSIFHPLGLVSRIKWNHLVATGMVSDIFDFAVGGLYAEYSPGFFTVGTGFYYDANQFHPHQYDRGLRFALPDSVPYADTLQAPVYVYELLLESDMLDRYDARYGAGIAFAQKILPDRTDGFAVRFPHVYGDFNRIRFTAGAMVEAGRFVAGQFHSFYPSNRSRVDSLGELVSQNLQLSRDRVSGGVYGSIEGNPFPGLYVGVSLRQDLFSQHPFVRYDSTFSALNFDYRVRAAMNDSLFKYIRFAEMYIEQTHGGLYPASGTYGSSWGFETGATILSAPLFANVSIEGGFRMGFLDLSDATGDAVANDWVDPADRITKIWGGIRWGML